MKVRLLRYYVKVLVKDENVLAGYTDKNKLVNLKDQERALVNSLMSKLTRQNNIL